MPKSVCKWYLVCPIKYYTDKGLLDSKWVNNYCLVANPKCVRYQMENTGQIHPDNMLPDGSIDETLKV
ncbi:uracil-DNA glycosylase [Candidatus Lokiarchaeum ossiferum]|uniref:uracil-DNA glycosylase n=1 Tax=Candidatus Lokiarchaeum ossiferum TaxID=2951803 RepID=UPI00352FA1A0